MCIKHDIAKQKTFELSLDKEISNPPFSQSYNYIVENHKNVNRAEEQNLS